MSDFKRTVIFLSEESLFLEFARECFKSEGHDFFDFSNWSECLGQLEDLKPELVLVDFDHFSSEKFLEIDPGKMPVVGFYSESLDSSLQNFSFRKIIKKPVDVLDLVSNCLG